MARLSEETINSYLRGSSGYTLNTLKRKYEERNPSMHRYKIPKYSQSSVSSTVFVPTSILKNESEMKSYNSTLKERTSAFPNIDKQCRSASKENISNKVDYNSQNTSDIKKKHFKENIANTNTNNIKAIYNRRKSEAVENTTKETQNCSKSENYKPAIINRRRHTTLTDSGHNKQFIRPSHKEEFKVPENILISPTITKIKKSESLRLGGTKEKDKPSSTARKLVNRRLTSCEDSTGASEANRLRIVTRKYSAFVEKSTEDMLSSGSDNRTKEKSDSYEFSEIEDIRNDRSRSARKLQNRRSTICYSSASEVNKLKIVTRRSSLFMLQSTASDTSTSTPNCGRSEPIKSTLTPETKYPSCANTELKKRRNSCTTDIQPIAAVIPNVNDNNYREKDLYKTNKQIDNISTKKCTDAEKREVEYNLIHKPNDENQKNNHIPRTTKRNKRNSKKNKRIFKHLNDTNSADSTCDPYCSDVSIDIYDEEGDSTNDDFFNEKRQDIVNCSSQYNSFGEAIEKYGYKWSEEESNFHVDFIEPLTVTESGSSRDNTIRFTATEDNIDESSVATEVIPEPVKSLIVKIPISVINISNFAKKNVQSKEENSPCKINENFNSVITPTTCISETNVNIKNSVNFESKLSYLPNDTLSNSQEQQTLKHVNKSKNSKEVIKNDIKTHGENINLNMFDNQNKNTNISTKTSKLDINCNRIDIGKCIINKKSNKEQTNKSLLCEHNQFKDLVNTKFKNLAGRSVNITSKNEANIAISNGHVTDIVKSNTVVSSANVTPLHKKIVPETSALSNCNNSANTKRVNAKSKTNCRDTTVILPNESPALLHKQENYSNIVRIPDLPVTTKEVTSLRKHTSIPPNQITSFQASRVLMQPEMKKSIVSQQNALTDDFNGRTDQVKITTYNIFNKPVCQNQAATGIVSTNTNVISEGKEVTSLTKNTSIPSNQITSFQASRVLMQPEMKKSTVSQQNTLADDFNGRTEQNTINTNNIFNKPTCQNPAAMGAVSKNTNVIPEGKEVNSLTKHTSIPSNQISSFQASRVLIQPEMKKSTVSQQNTLADDFNGRTEQNTINTNNIFNKPTCQNPAAMGAVSKNTNVIPEGKEVTGLMKHTSIPSNQITSFQANKVLKHPEMKKNTRSDRGKINTNNIFNKAVCQNSGAMTAVSKNTNMISEGVNTTVEFTTSRNKTSAQKTDCANVINTTGTKHTIVSTNNEKLINSQCTSSFAESIPFLIEACLEDTINTENLPCSILLKQMKLRALQQLNPLERALTSTECACLIKDAFVLIIHDHNWYENIGYELMSSSDPTHINLNLFFKNYDLHLLNLYNLLIGTKVIDFDMRSFLNELLKLIKINDVNYFNKDFLIQCFNISVTYLKKKFPTIQNSSLWNYILANVIPSATNSADRTSNIFEPINKYNSYLSYQNENTALHNKSMPSDNTPNSSADKITLNQTSASSFEVKSSNQQNICHSKSNQPLQNLLDTTTVTREEPSQNSRNTAQQSNTAVPVTTPQLIKQIMPVHTQSPDVPSVLTASNVIRYDQIALDNECIIEKLPNKCIDELISTWQQTSTNSIPMVIVSSNNKGGSNQTPIKDCSQILVNSDSSVVNSKITEHFSNQHMNCISQLDSKAIDGECYDAIPINLTVTQKNTSASNAKTTVPNQVENIQKQQISTSTQSKIVQEKINHQSIPPLLQPPEFNQVRRKMNRKEQQSRMCEEPPLQALRNYVNSGYNTPFVNNRGTNQSAIYNQGFSNNYNANDSIQYGIGCLNSHRQHYPNQNSCHYGYSNSYGQYYYYPTRRAEPNYGRDAIHWKPYPSPEEGRFNLQPTAAYYPNQSCCGSNQFGSRTSRELPMPSTYLPQTNERRNTRHSSVDSGYTSPGTSNNPRVHNYN